MKKYAILRILATLLPAIIFTQNYALMTLNKGLGYAFLAIWIFSIFLVWHTSGKNKIWSEIFRLSEIGAFLLPISALAMIFVLGNLLFGELEGNSAAQAGAGIGMAVGGFFSVGIAFVVGLFGGIIFHLLADRFEKKSASEQQVTETPTNFFYRHKILVTIAFVIILIIISNLFPRINSQNDEGETEEAMSTSENLEIAEAESEQENQTQNTEPSPVEITDTVVKKNDFGTVIVTLTLQNTSEKDADGIKVEMKTFDNFGEPANGFLSDNTFRGISQETIASGETTTASWELFNYDNTTKVDARVFGVHFTDDSSWGE